VRLLPLETQLAKQFTFVCPSRLQARTEQQIMDVHRPNPLEFTDRLKFLLIENAGLRNSHSLKVAMRTKSVSRLLIYAEVSS